MQRWGCFVACGWPLAGEFLCCFHNRLCTSCPCSRGGTDRLGLLTAEGATAAAQVVVWNRNPDKCRPLQEEGAKVRGRGRGGALW